MAEVIHYNYLLIPVIRRFGIRLGFGDKTVKILCLENKIDVGFFLLILNTFSNKDYFPYKNLQQFDVFEFVNYLRKTHADYLNEQVPIIEKNINDLLNSCTDGNKNLMLVKKFFQDYKHELEEHLAREESRTFPYIENLFKLYTGEFSEEKYLSVTGSYSMKRFSQEHDNIDDKLFDLQNILIKYLNGNFSEELTITVLFELFRLEKDIKNHTRLEELILRPMVIEMENTLKSYIV